MPEPVLISRQRELLRDLMQRAAERAQIEPTIPVELQEQTETIENEFTEGRESVCRRLEREQGCGSSGYRESGIRMPIYD